MDDEFLKMQVTFKSKLFQTLSHRSQHVWKEVSSVTLAAQEDAEPEPEQEFVTVVPGLTSLVGSSICSTLSPSSSLSQSENAQHSYGHRT